MIRASRIRPARLIVVGILIALTSLASSAGATRYVCGPCGMPCDTLSYDKPGVCPVCGIALVEAGAAAAITAAEPKVGILIFNGVEIIDYTGPWEVFGASGFEVYTVAATRDPVTTAMGMKVVPQYTFADAPQPDVLLVPGGGVRKTLSDAPTLDWVRKMNVGTRQTLSVCNGAFILASAGLLDGLTATTTAHNIEPMRTQYPKVKVVNDQRFVDNGKIVTTGGLTAGIDGALHVVSKLSGEGAAQEVALGLEYDWHPKTPFTRAAFADMLIPRLDLDPVAKFDVESTQGDTEHWDAVLRATSSLTATQLMGKIAEQLRSNGKWTDVTGPGDANAARVTTRWKFSDSAGRPWSATVAIENAAGKSGQYTTRVSLARKTS